MLLRHMAVAGMVLGLFAVIGTGLVAVTFDRTKDQIAANERAAILRSLNALVPANQHTNDMLEDSIKARAPQFLGSTDPVTVYRAYKNGRPVAAVFSTIAPDGYSGNIKLLVAVHYEGIVAGVRVVSHKETPGLGDAIERERSDWILSFDGRSLSNPTAAGWRVEKDGGAFDQFTGATITPRAVVNAVHNTLKYFAAHRDEIFDATPSEELNHASG